MVKFKFAAVILWLTMALPALSQPAPADLNCYVQATQDGRVINLGQLCSNLQGSPIQLPNRNGSEVTATPVSDPAHKTSLSASINSYDGDSLVGTVTNNSDRTALFVVVHYEILDEQGSVISTGTIDTGAEDVGPGESVTFNGVGLKHGYTIRPTFVQWTWAN
ncbi:hypothetical protein DO97_21420 [Neosynechococcus sphagnicola sy1]|uniref:Secreted protein n=1 Tax=Neosynechococcus sphagnicola sy1 TaxID=1497020 RepID=A0A098TM64_9CYAN|nr:FxLYD domain-containing protein [Neosynechococcus sphagnicola]KGF73356.1 hypothetical protein DO97_21420 [Neosynechococcus sphagnicola sy1]